MSYMPMVTNLHGEGGAALGIALAVGFGACVAVCYLQRNKPRATFFFPACAYGAGVMLTLLALRSL